MAFPPIEASRPEIENVYSYAELKAELAKDADNLGIRPLDRSEAFIITSSKAKQNQAKELGIRFEPSSSVAARIERTYVGEYPETEGVFPLHTPVDLLHPCVSLINAEQKVVQDDVVLGALGDDTTAVIVVREGENPSKYYLDTALNSGIRRLNIQRALIQPNPTMYVESTLALGLPSINSNSASIYALTVFLEYALSMQEFEEAIKALSSASSLPAGINLAEDRFAKELTSIAIVRTYEKNRKKPIMNERKFNISSGDVSQFALVPKGLSKVMVDLLPIKSRS